MSEALYTSCSSENEKPTIMLKCGIISSLKQPIPRNPSDARTNGHHSAGKRMVIRRSCDITKHSSARWTSEPASTKQYKAMPAKDVYSTATTARLFNWRTGIYFNIRLVAGGSCWAHTILYLRSHRYKCLLDICCTFCTCFKERDAQLVGILLQLPTE